VVLVQQGPTPREIASNLGEHRHHFYRIHPRHRDLLLDPQSPIQFLVVPPLVVVVGGDGVVVGGAVLERTLLVAYESVAGVPR